jgi:hypothetical protein
VSSLRAPGARTFPPLEEHLVTPEVTRDEVVRGRRVVAQPSHPPHGDRHCELDYVVRGHIRRDYIGSTDMITRTSADSDFATDTSVRKAGTNSATGERWLEELAFEVVHTQSTRDMIDRAEDLALRGVRRVFAIFVKEGTVREWSRAASSFQTLALGDVIQDDCLSTPIPVRALLDAAEADNAVARALLAKGNPVLAARAAASKNQGKAEGKAEAILTVLAARGVLISDDDRARITACADDERLRVWLVRAVMAGCVDDVVQDR